MILALALVLSGLALMAYEAGNKKDGEPETPEPEVEP